MKRTMLLLVLAFLGALLAAQDYNPYLNMMHSARCADGNLKVRWDDVSGNFLGTQCLYSAEGSAWQQAAVEQLSGTQMQALVPYTYGQSLRYRLRTEITYQGESLVYMQTPFLNADSWPPTLSSLGQIGTDATGDSVTVYDDVLDFTGSWFGSTPNKLYSALGNSANSFPTMNSITSYNVYGTIIANPASVVDTLAFAMLYTFNIPGVISPGLYKASIDDTGMPFYERIGDIQSQVLGGKLYLACNWADLTGDPDFGAWPNAYNALAISSLSMRMAYNIATGDIDFGIGDYSLPAALLFADNHYDVPVNDLPQALNLTVNSGSNTVSFDYLDANGDFPLQADFVITDGPTVSLLPESYDFSQSVHFTAVLPYLPASGQLLLSDNGVDVVQVNWDGVDAPMETVPAPILSCRMANPLRWGSTPYSIALDGLERGPVNVEVFNLRGQNLGSLYAGTADAAGLELNWDGQLGGNALDSGLYFLRITQNGRALNRKFVLAR